MAKESIKIELNEEDIKKIVAEKYNLDPSKTDVSINHYRSDPRDPREVSTTRIIVTGQLKNGFKFS